MQLLIQRMIREDDGVLSFEWVLMITVVVIGIVAGIAASRDAVVDEIGDAAEAMVALDQSYVIDFPLMPFFLDDDIGLAEPTGGGSDSGFSDAFFALDCSRGNTNAGNGQAEEVDLN